MSPEPRPPSPASPLLPRISLVGRVGLGLVFVWAGLPKLLDPASLATAIENYRVLPSSLSGVSAVLLPVFELTLAAALASPRLARGALLLSSLLLFVFAAAMAQARARGIDLECGCFGASVQTAVSWWTVARSALLCVFAAGLYVLATRLARADDRGVAGDPPVLSS